jgi:CheY-like chemotaxis protein
MHALDQTARAAGQPRFNVWARELAATAHRAFAYGPPGSRRLVWKMSSDFSRALVPSMGQHHALDGLVVDAARLEQLAARGAFTDTYLIDHLLRVSIPLVLGAVPRLRVGTQLFTVATPGLLRCERACEYGCCTSLVRAPPRRPIAKGAAISSSAVVLIVDDDACIREPLREMLEDEGFRVETAGNGREALDLLIGGLRPSAILLDVMMPVMDGWAFRAEQLRMADVAKVPVAVLSASGMSSREIRARMGEVEYIRKPMAPDAILRFVERCRLPGGAGGPQFLGSQGG